MRIHRLMCVATVGLFSLVNVRTACSAELVGHWPLDQIVSGATPRANSGVLAGAGLLADGPIHTSGSPEWVVTTGGGGRIGEAMIFNGTFGVDMVGVLSQLPSGAQVRTVMAWVLRDSTSDTDDPVVGWGGEDEGSKFEIKFVGPDVGVDVGGHFWGVPNLTTVGWHHIAAVLPDGATRSDQIMLFIDGAVAACRTLAGEVQDVATLNSIGTPALIGHGVGEIAASSRFNGRIDDVRVYTGAMGGDQIRQTAGLNPYAVTDLAVPWNSGLTGPDEENYASSRALGIDQRDRIVGTGMTTAGVSYGFKTLGRRIENVGSLETPSAGDPLATQTTTKMVDRNDLFPIGYSMTDEFPAQAGLTALRKYADYNYTMAGYKNFTPNLPSNPSGVTLVSNEFTAAANSLAGRLTLAAFATDSLGNDYPYYRSSSWVLIKPANFGISGYTGPGYGRALGVNDAATHIVGVLDNHAFRLSGTYLVPSVLNIGLAGLTGHDYSLANDVNDSFAMVGVSGMSQTLLDGTRRAVMWKSDNSIVSLGNLTASGRGEAMAINNKGVVVGWADNMQGQTGFVINTANGDRMYDLQQLISSQSGWRIESTVDINDHGRIVGWGTNPDVNGERAILLEPDGLVGHWGFEEASGDLAIDSSPSGRHGRLGDTVASQKPSRISDGHLGGALRFDGVDDVVVVGTAQELGFTSSARDEFTIMAWVRTTNPDAGTIFSRGVAESELSSNYNWQYRLHVTHDPNIATNGVVGVNLWGNTKRCDTAVVTGQSVSGWHHVAVVGAMEDGVDQIHLVTYLDGVRQSGHFTLTQTNAGPTLDFLIGAIRQATNNTGLARPFQGDIDEVKIYRRPLSDKEVAAEIKQPDYLTVYIEGPDEPEIVQEGQTVRLNASVLFDGLRSIVPDNISWQVVSGPSGSTVDDLNEGLQANITFPEGGEYTIRVTVSDASTGTEQYSDELKVIVAEGAQLLGADLNSPARQVQNYDWTYELTDTDSVTHQMLMRAGVVQLSAWLDESLQAQRVWAEVSYKGQHQATLELDRRPFQHPGDPNPLDVFIGDWRPASLGLYHIKTYMIDDQGKCFIDDDVLLIMTPPSALPNLDLWLDANSLQSGMVSSWPNLAPNGSVTQLDRIIAGNGPTTSTWQNIPRPNDTTVAMQVVDWSGGGVPLGNYVQEDEAGEWSCSETFVVTKPPAWGPGPIYLQDKTGVFTSAPYGSNQQERDAWHTANPYDMRLEQVDNVYSWTAGPNPGQYVLGPATSDDQQVLHISNRGYVGEFFVNGQRWSSVDWTGAASGIAEFKGFRFYAVGQSSGQVGASGYSSNDWRGQLAAVAVFRGDKVTNADDIRPQEVLSFEQRRAVTNFLGWTWGVRVAPSVNLYGPGGQQVIHATTNQSVTLTAIAADANENQGTLGAFGLHVNGQTVSVTPTQITPFMQEITWTPTQAGTYELEATVSESVADPRVGLSDKVRVVVEDATSGTIPPSQVIASWPVSGSTVAAPAASTTDATPLRWAVVINKDDASIQDITDSVGNSILTQATVTDAGAIIEVAALGQEGLISGQHHRYVITYLWDDDGDDDPGDLVQAQEIIEFTVDQTLPIARVAEGSPKGGRVATRELQVRLEAVEPDGTPDSTATIYYTFDGSEPTDSSSSASSGQLISIRANGQRIVPLRIMAIDAAGNVGPLAEEVYVFDLPLRPPVGLVATVDFEPQSGSDDYVAEVSLTWQRWVAESTDAFNPDHSGILVYRAVTPAEVRLLEAAVAGGYPPPASLRAVDSALPLDAVDWMDVGGVRLTADAKYCLTVVDDQGAESTPSPILTVAVNFPQDQVLGDELTSIGAGRQIKRNASTALQWLLLKQNSNGSWGDGQGDQRIIETCQVLDAIKQLDDLPVESGTPSWTSVHSEVVFPALMFVKSATASGNEAMARKVLTLARYDLDADTWREHLLLINSAEFATGLTAPNQSTPQLALLGWGATNRHSSDAFHTSWAAMALSSIEISRLPGVLAIWGDPNMNASIEALKRRYFTDRFYDGTPASTGHPWVPGQEKVASVSSLAYQVAGLQASTDDDWMAARQQNGLVDGNLYETATVMIHWPSGLSSVSNATSRLLELQDVAGHWKESVYLTAAALEAIIRSDY